MGTTRLSDNYHMSGTVPSNNAWLKRAVINGVIEQAVFWNIQADTPSKPVALVVSRANRRSKTSSSVHNKSVLK